MRQWLKQPAIFVGILAFVFGVVVWPTPWSTHVNAQHGIIIHVNRLTGVAHAWRVPEGRTTVLDWIDWWRTAALATGVVGAVGVLLIVAHRRRVR